MALDREQETYRRELPRLLEGGHEGQFVLIHGENVADCFGTQEEAVQAGDERYGLEPFLVRQVLSEEHPRFAPYALPPQCRS